MTERDDPEIQRAANENLHEVLEKGPGLRFSTQTWVEARDRKRGYVLIGGLGGMGVGQMWFKDRGRTDALGYEDAPEKDSRGGMGTPEQLKSLWGDDECPL